MSLYVHSDTLFTSKVSSHFVTIPRPFRPFTRSRNIQRRPSLFLHTGKDKNVTFCQKNLTNLSG